VDVPSNVILDKDETTVAFPEDATTSSKFHRGKNLHHIIFANPSDSTKIYVDYSLNGEHFFTVFTTATNGDNLYWDTGAHVPPPLLGTTALGAGGGVNACPPVLVRLRVGSGDFSVLNVRTYGTVVR
tara:strand:+ start:3270 stop:3650 length:381 start_codon:yes stop_codon:yes gene_type:complete